MISPVARRLAAALALTLLLPSFAQAWPNGSTTQTENGSQLDPSGAASPGENGSQLDPHGRT